MNIALARARAPRRRRGRARALRRCDGVARRAIVKGREDDEGCLTFQDLEDSGYGERVHPNRHVLAMVFEHPQRQDDGPLAIDGGANSGAAASTRTHEASSAFPRGYSSRLPLSASNRWTASKFGDSSRLSPG